MKGLDAAEVGDVLGVDAASERDATLREAWAISDSDFGNDVVQVTTIDDAVVTIEPNGWHGTEPEIAAALSQGGRYAAYFWNVNSVMTFVFCERGLVVRSFDPLLYESGSTGPALPEEAGLPFPSGDDAPLTPGQASLTLIERLTGIEIGRDWLLQTRRPTYRVSPEARDTPRWRG